jgi:hypothetical protein
MIVFLMTSANVSLKRPPEWEPVFAVIVTLLSEPFPTL